MYKLEKEDSRLNIASKVFGWKKATMKDVARELKVSEEELEECSDKEYLEIMMYFANTLTMSS